MRGSNWRKPWKCVKSEQARTMPDSVDRFLTTHTGSLPRPDDLIQMMFAKEEGMPVDREALAGASAARSARSSAKQRQGRHRHRQ